MDTARLNRAVGKQSARLTATVGSAVSAIVSQGAPAARIDCANHRIIVARNARVSTSTRTISVDGALAIPAGTPHAVLAAEDEPLASIYMDVQRYGFKEVEHVARLWRKFKPGHDASLDLFDDIVKLQELRIDRRIMRSLACFNDGATVAETARHVQLSESRLTHLFSEQIGLSPRDFRRWLLLRRGLFFLYTGESPSRAAHLAGFADAAHLARTTRVVLGATPSLINSLETTFITPRGTVIERAKFSHAGRSAATNAMIEALRAGGASGLSQILR
jgi:AraC-like DNA-binding protein